ncbi:MAG: sugar ABC transporter ATP-binding protein [Acidimicrobiales bacterium]
MSDPMEDPGAHGGDLDSGARDPGSDRPVALRISHLSKTFPGTRALDDVSLTVTTGTIHCLLGGNGSGKSSLIKILAGVYRADPGGRIRVRLHELDADKTSPEWARSVQLHFVHQDLAIFNMMSVAENLAIGRGFPVSPLVGGIRWRALRRHTKTVLERFGVDVNPGRLVGDLRPADRTMVAIARALQDQADASEGLLVLDEPTVALPAVEVDILFGALKRYAAAGQTIVFVTHRLEEVTRIADRVTVLRDGRVVTTLESSEVTKDRLVELIVGRALDDASASGAALDAGDLALEVTDLAGGPLRGVSFGLRKGEVLGIAGLVGSGRTSVLTTLFGVQRPAHGVVKIDGKPVAFTDVDQAMDAGLGFVPEDRSESAFVNMTLRENLSAAQVSKYWRTFLLREREESADARQSIVDFSIKAISERQPFATLSGGNQQKAIVARWLRRKPKLLLLDEPTQGVDVEARAEIYRLVREAVASGTSVIVVTADLEELARVSDRVLVLANGQIAHEIQGPDIDPARVTELVLSATTDRAHPHMEASQR